jgi:hypothetical protein
MLWKTFASTNSHLLPYWSILACSNVATWDQNFVIQINLWIAGFLLLVISSHNSIWCSRSKTIGLPYTRIHICSLSLDRHQMLSIHMFNPGEVINWVSSSFQYWNPDAYFLHLISSLVPDLALCSLGFMVQCATTPGLASQRCEPESRQNEWRLSGRWMANSFLLAWACILIVMIVESCVPHHFVIVQCCSPESVHLDSVRITWSVRFCVFRNYSWKSRSDSK